MQQSMHIKSSKKSLGVKSSPNKVQKRKETNVNVCAMLEKSKLLFLCHVPFIYVLPSLHPTSHPRTTAGGNSQVEGISDTDNSIENGTQKIQTPIADIPPYPP